MASQEPVSHFFPTVNANDNARIHLGDVHNHIELPTTSENAIKHSRPATTKSIRMSVQVVLQARVIG